MLDLLCIGELTILETIKINTFPQQGEHSFIEKFESMIGNDAPIVSIFFGKHGGNVRLISNKVNRNSGKPLLNLLKKSNVKVSPSILDENIQTPKTFCISDNDLKRTWLTSNEKIFPSTTTPLPKSKFIYIDIYEEQIDARIETIIKLIEKNPSSKIFLNLSASSKEEKISLINNIKGIYGIQYHSYDSIEDARKEAMSILNLEKLSLILITFGSWGSVGFRKDEESIVQVPENLRLNAKVTGTGAMFSASYMYALTNGANFKEAHIFANNQSVSFAHTQNNMLIL